MTYFLDAVGSRQMTVITDAFALRSTNLPNGDPVIEETNGASRSYRAVDSGAGVAAAYLPNWGTTDWTFMVMLHANGNLNPDGFSNYWCCAATDSSYLNPTLRIFAIDDEAWRLSVWALTGVANVDLNNFSQDIDVLWVVRCESSNLSGGRIEAWRNGRRVSDNAHGITAAGRASASLFQWGGRNGTNNYGVLNSELLAKLAVCHAWIPDEEIIELAEEMGVYPNHA